MVDKEKKRQKMELFYYQQEDEFLQELVEYYFDYELPNPQSSDSRRVFTDEGVETFRRVFVLKGEKLKKFQSIIDKELQ